MAPTLVQITNTGDSDIIIDGTINNPIGTTSIINSGGGDGGSVLSNEARGTFSDGSNAIVRTSIIPERGCDERRRFGRRSG